MITFDYEKTFRNRSYRITKRSYEDNPESTFTPLPRNITPLGIELDPTTGTDLSSTDEKWTKKTQVNSGKSYRKLAIIYWISGTP